MTVFFLQARADEAADRVAISLSKLEIVRLAVGTQPAPITLSGVDVVVAWTGAASALGWARFAALFDSSCAVTLIQYEEAALPQESNIGFVVQPWRDGGMILRNLLHKNGPGNGQGSGQGLARPDGTNNAAKIAAGVVAALGVMAAGAAQPAQANPVAITRRESTEKRDAGIAQAAQAALEDVSQRAPIADAIVRSAARAEIVDLDALLGALAPTHDAAAKALVDAMMKPAPIRASPAREAPKRRIASIIPGMMIRPS